MAKIQSGVLPCLVADTVDDLNACLAAHLPAIDNHSFKSKTGKFIKLITQDQFQALKQAGVEVLAQADAPM